MDKMRYAIGCRQCIQTSGSSLAGWLICQTAKFKFPPKFPAIRYIVPNTYLWWTNEVCNRLKFKLQAHYCCLCTSFLYSSGFFSVWGSYNTTVLHNIIIFSRYIPGTLQCAYNLVQTIDSPTSNALWTCSYCVTGAQSHWVLYFSWYSHDMHCVNNYNNYIWY